MIEHGIFLSPVQAEMADEIGIHCCYFTYRSSGGRIGFDSSKDAEDVWQLILSNGAIWNKRGSSLDHFISEHGSLIDPFRFLWSTGDASRLVFHGCSEMESKVQHDVSLQEELSNIPSVSNNNSLSFIIKALSYSEYITKWEVAQASAYIYTKSETETKNIVIEWQSRTAAETCFVEDISKMPQW